MTTKSETLLLVQKCAHTFSFYNLANGEAEKHIVLPNFPHEFTVDPVRRRAYVGHYGIETASHLGEKAKVNALERLYEPPAALVDALTQNEQRTLRDLLRKEVAAQL